MVSTNFLTETPEPAGLPLSATRCYRSNAEEGRAILEPHLSDQLQMQPTMLDAAKQAVELAGKAN